MNTVLAQKVVEQLQQLSVADVIICPGGRNIPLVFQLDDEPAFHTYYWFEERSAAFFALGRSKVTELPTAVITTSGTAAAELLPAAMEAFYLGIPLLLITADRPRKMRGSGAPQTTDQTELFHKHVTFALDVENAQQLCFDGWSRCGPAHLNLSFEEPL